MLVLNALADPTRQRIVEMLADCELSAGAIAERFDMSPPAISQHLKVLNPEGFDELEQWMTRIRRYWRGSLDALERVLKEEDRKSKSGKGKR